MMAEATFEMWATLLLTAVIIVAYALERIPVELTALGALGALLLLFHLAPLATGAAPVLGASELLAGFASPALIAVSALLVVGQAIVHTGALDGVARTLFRLARRSFPRALAIALAAVSAISGVLNNTPIVVIFIPVLRAVAERYARPNSAVMMPLSYAAILGGMLTLIGSSSNLLVSGELAALGLTPFRFFDLTPVGLMIAVVGSVYLLVLPRFLPKRPLPGGALATEGKQFIAEIDIGEDSPLIGETSRGGLFARLGEVTVRLVQRGNRTFLPPFEELELAAGDILIVAATRKTLTELLAAHPGHLLRAPDGDVEPPGPSRGRRDLMLAEAMVRPASRMAGQTLELTNFAARSRLTVLGVQRRARMLRTRLTELRLEPGDVLLLLGSTEAIEGLQADPDVVLMEWSATEMPAHSQAWVTLAIFAGIVLPAALDLVPIVITALVGVVALLAAGCLNIRQAARAVDRRIFLIVGSALALGTALEATGGATYLATLLLDAMAGASAPAVLSTFFLLVALLTNILSNNACAVLFTPIAVQVASGLEVNPFPFALAVAIGANCSFATPIGYQTNLLVMGPGQYRFVDFALAGLPLIVLVWATFSLFVPWYYGL